MGASQSSSQNGGSGGGRGNGRPMTSDGIDTQDYYGLLELPDPGTATSSSDEIRKSYRRLALRHHPDKNKDDVEAANERFRLIQAAYEVLSDEQERAWYDGHREQILQGYGDGDEDDEDAAFDEETFQSFRTGKQKPPPAPTGSSAPGLTPRHILRFLDVSLCMDTTPPSADESGFFGTYRRIFERLAEEEKGAAAYAGESQMAYETLPGFGYAHTPYLHAKTADAEETVHQTQVRDFYAAWGAFATRKGFAWRDGHRLNEAPDRRVKRAMEKANKTMRDASRREYNDTVRSLVSFVRKRDPRFKAHVAATQAAQQASVNAAATPEQAERRKRAVEQERRAQEEQARAAFKKQSWDAWQQDDGSDVDDDSEASFGRDVRGHGVGGGEDEEDGEESDGGDGGYDEDAALECVACEKVFQSEAAFSNHERSNKHKKQVQKLRREMLKEDRALREDMASMGVQDDARRANDDLKVKLPPVQNASEDVVAEVDDDEDEQDDAMAGLSKKARQKLKKRLKEQEKAAASASASAAASTTPSATATAQTSADEDEGEQASADASAAVSESNSASAQHPHNGTPTKKSRRANKDGGVGGKAKEHCNVCSTGFPSRSKLFNHIRETGHAAAGSQPALGKRA